MSALPLTEQQEKLWRFIGSSERSPSFEEMSHHLYGRTTDKGSIHRLLGALEERGFIRRINNRARSIIAVNPLKPALENAKTSELLAELERRGILLGLPQ